MDSLREALEYIMGYCEKHKRCEGCKLYKDNFSCMLMLEEPPCDWRLPEKE